MQTVMLSRRRSIFILSILLEIFHFAQDNKALKSGLVIAYLEIKNPAEAGFCLSA
jgi:hypothetical protein